MLQQTLRPRATPTTLIPNPGNAITIRRQVRMRTLREEHQAETMLLTAHHTEACRLLEATTGERTSPGNVEGSATVTLQQELEGEIRRERAKHRLVTGKLQAEVAEGKKQYRAKEAELIQLGADLEARRCACNRQPI